MIADPLYPQCDSSQVSPQESREYWIASPVQQTIRQILSTDMSSTTIKRCRLVWALDSDPDLGGEGIRAIIAASGLSNKFVQKTLPAEGEQDALGLIRCVKQGQGGIDPLANRRSRYVVVGNRSDPSRKEHITNEPDGVSSTDPTTNHYITSVANRISPAQTVSPGLEGIKDRHAQDVVNRCGVPSNIRQTLNPGHDIWAVKNMSDLGWALVVVYGPNDIGHPHEDGPTLSLGDLRRLTGKTQQGVHATLKKWDKAEHTVPFMKVETPGKATMLFIMFGQLVDDSYHLRADKRNHLQELHLAEAKLHKQRMTAAGARAWVLSAGKEWLFKGEVIPVIPSDVLAEGELAVYEHLVALEEAEKAEETLEEAAQYVRVDAQPESAQRLLAMAQRGDPDGHPKVNDSFTLLSLVA